MATRNTAADEANRTKQTTTKTRIPGIERVTGARGVAYRVRVELPPDPTTGKRRQRTETFPSMKEAERAQIRWRAEIERGTVVDTTKLTVADVSAQWLTVKRPDLKPRTLVEYRRTLKTITTNIGALPIQRVQPANIDAFYALLREQGKSEDAVHRAHQRLMQMFAYAIKRRIIAVNPMHAIDAPIVRSQDSIILTAPQIARFLAFATKDGYSPLWLLLIQTGMRRGEALGLRWQDVDLLPDGTGRIRVRQCVEVLEVPAVGEDGASLLKADGTPQARAIPSIQTPKSPAARRTITLFPESIAALKAHRARYLARRMRAETWEDNDLVFCTPTGSPLNPNNALRNLAVIQQKANERAEADNAQPLPKFDIHDLRHTHATHLIRERWDIVTVSRRLGHANPAITMRIYAHALADVPDGNLVTPAALASVY